MMPLVFCVMSEFFSALNIDDFLMQGENCRVEPGKGFASHGHGRLENFASPFQLAEVVDYIAW